MELERSAQRIDGTDIINWFRSGSQEVQRSRRRLNAINVFPVADGDTGTNLSTTLRAMVDRPTQDRSFSATLRALSDLGLSHARGNSGILFATYISGIAAEGAAHDSVTVEEFAQIANRAVSHLYHAVERPVEGTMITVIREWASTLARHASRFPSFGELMAEGYSAAGAALQRTASQLEVLRRNNVVDAGAEGFVRFLEGINRALSGDAERVDAEPVPELTIAPESEMASGYRYCTEVLIETPEGAPLPDEIALESTLQKQLHGYGDSLIVSARASRTRVHIHTDTPARVVEDLTAYGSVLEQKVDDMRLQASVREHRLHPVGLLTDSIADLPETFKLENQIHTLPLGLLLDGTAYLDKITIQPGQLTEAISRSEAYPTSSLPEPGRVRAFLEGLIDLYESLIFVTVSSQMSGTNRIITQALQDIDLQGKKVAIVDSLTNAGAEGLLVQSAANLLNEGASHDEVVARLGALIPRARIYVCLDTLEYAVRSGRVPNTVGKLGIKLGLRPIMSVDPHGRGTAFGAAFSQGGLTKKIRRLVRRHLATTGVLRYAIVHVGNPALAAQYAAELGEMIGRQPEYITEVSAVIGIHSGPGSVAVCLIEGEEASGA